MRSGQRGKSGQNGRPQSGFPPPLALGSQGPPHTPGDAGDPTRDGRDPRDPGAPPQAIVVLGCRVLLDPAGRLVPGALARRVSAAARTYLQRADARTIVVPSGGRRWQGLEGRGVSAGDNETGSGSGAVREGIEADAMAHELVILGVPEAAVVRERCSFSTRENARYTAELLRRRGIDRALLVTCAWHLPRAVTLFTREGLEVEAVPAPGTGSRDLGLWPRRLLRWGIERVLSRV